VRGLSSSHKVNFELHSEELSSGKVIFELDSEEMNGQCPEVDMSRSMSEQPLDHERVDVIRPSDSMSAVKRPHLLQAGANSVVEDILREAFILDDLSLQGGDGKPPTRLDRARAVARELVGHFAFEYIVGFIIFVNAVCLGIQSQSSLEGRYFPDNLDLGFLAVYVFELGLKLLLGGWSCFRDVWFLFDFAMVSIGFFSSLFEILGVSSSGFLQAVMVLRTLRLLRLIRALRTVPAFRTMWRLVNGLLASSSTMVSTLMLIFLALYIFACLGLELITKDADLASHPDTAFIVAYNFGTLFKTMVTLVQFISCDSVASVYHPLVIHKPVLVIYFGLIIMFVPIALMNLVTAVLVEGAMEQAQQDKDVEKADLKQKVMADLPHLFAVFDELDADGSGFITREEMEQVP
ncbi:unnamed protein product, partial [Polarella glacialis]